MIENNPTNVSAAFEMLLEEVEAEIDFTYSMERGPVGPRQHGERRSPQRRLTPRNLGDCRQRKSGS